MKSIHPKVIKAVSSYACVKVVLSDRSLMGIAIGVGRFPKKTEQKEYEFCVALALVTDKDSRLSNILHLPETEVVELAYSAIKDIEFL